MNRPTTAAEAAPFIERLARVGYASKAVLYATIGLLAAKAAAGLDGGRATDTRGAMAELLDAPFGHVLLVVVALGLAGYAAWRLVSAIADPEHRGSDAKGLAMRASYVGRAIVHLALAWSALRLAMHHASGGGAAADRWTGRALSLPGGSAIVWAAAAALLGYAAWQLWRAATAKLSRDLDVGRMSAEAGRWVIGVSRFGIAARGVVFGAIGVLLARAASHRAPSEAGNVGDALRTLAQLGRAPLAAIALGLVAYGVYELLQARYRRIRARDR